MPPPAGRDGSLFSEDDGLREEQMNERTGLNFGGNNSLIDN